MNLFELISKINIFRILCILFLTIFFFGFVRDLTIPIYDWDLDTEMYFGSRLLKGELIYLNEFHDKLPFIQYIFSILSIFKSHGFFTLLSGFSSIFSVVFFRISFFNAVTKTYENSYHNNIKEIVNFFCSIFLALSVLLPSSLNGISALSSSINLLAIGIILWIPSSRFFSFNNEQIIFIISSSIVISIRPYLIFPILSIPIWRYASLNLEKIDLFELRISKEIFKKIWKLLVYWIFPIIIFTIFINTIPYILTNNFDFFLNGIKHNSQELIPSSVIQVLINHISSFFIYLPNLSRLVVIFCFLNFFLGITNLGGFQIKVLKNNRNIDYIFCSVIFPLLLYLSFSLKHFHSHYYHLYSPYLLLSLSYLFILILKDKKFLLSRSKKIFLKLIIFSFFIILLKPDFQLIFEDLSKFGVSHPSYQKKILVERYINNQSKSKDFLYPSSSYIHWQFNQSRFGFPHAGNINHIYRDYWKNIIQNGDIETPSNSLELCEMYQKKGPDVIILDENVNEYNCLSNKYSNYFLDQKYIISNQEEIYFFIRKD